MSITESQVRPGLMVDLDSLFDVPLAILDELDPLLAIHALKNGYLDREDNDFKYCPLSLFNELYAKRDSAVLGRAMMTQVKNIVIDFIKDANKKLKSSKSSAYPSVYINVYPYKISSDAAGEILVPFHKAVEGKVHIHLVNMSPKEITPEVCKERFSHLIMYNYMEWLIEMGKLGLLVRNPMNEVTLIGPRLYPGGKPPEHDNQDQTRNSMQPHECAELYFAPFVKLELYVAKLFSASLDQDFIDKLVESVGQTQSAS